MTTHLYVVSRLKMIAATLQNPLFQHGLQKDNLPFPLISGFSRDVDEICALLGYYSIGCWLSFFLTRTFDPRRRDRYVFPKRR
jgi:hypothetical protein